MALPTKDVSPYKFLDAYRFDERDIFFGREPETERLLADVLVNRVLVLFAETGTGKTSLINAGVRPRLEDLGFATFLVRVTRDPSDSFLAAVADELNARGGASLPEGTLAEQMLALPKLLEQPVVLFFDQFEEFFLYALKDDPSKAHEFIEQIGHVYITPTSGVLLVWSMRADFFAEMDVFRDVIPTIFNAASVLRLRGLNTEAARAAIRKPAAARGVLIEPALEERLITDLADGGLIEPTRLQIVCQVLWSHRANGTISLAEYQQLGEAKPGQSPAEQILAAHLGEVLDPLSQQQLSLLVRLLPLLRTPRGTKQIRDLDSLAQELSASASALHELLDVLEHAGLVKRRPRGDVVHVELAHDFLVKQLDELTELVALIAPRRALRAASNRWLTRVNSPRPKSWQSSAIGRISSPSAAMSSTCCCDRH